MRDPNLSALLHGLAYERQHGSGVQNALNKNPYGDLGRQVKAWQDAKSRKIQVAAASNIAREFGLHPTIHDAPWR